MRFKHLIDRLNRCIIDQRMPLKELTPLMNEYYRTHDRNEISVYEHMLRSSLKRQQDYNKFVPYINQTFEINVLYWGRNAISKVHDHPENGCHATIMKGCIKERRYNPYYFQAFDDTTLSLEKMKEIIKPGKPTYLHPGDSNYIGGYEIHDMINSSAGYTPDGTALSIHIYSPPNHYIPDNVINFNVIEGKIEYETPEEKECYFKDPLIMSPSL